MKWHAYTDFSCILVLQFTILCILKRMPGPAYVHFQNRGPKK